MAARSDKARDKLGRFVKKRSYLVDVSSKRVIIEHNYISGIYFDDESRDGSAKDCTKSINSDWKSSRRVIEISMLLNSLRACEKCKLGPVI